MASSDTDRRDEEESHETGANEDEDTGAQIAPIIKLEEVAVTTGEEDEDAILDLKAKLYRFDKDGNQWKERGTGNVKLLKHKETGKVRLVMRQAKTLKICANHYVFPTIKIQEHIGNEKSCVWHAPDYSDGELKEEMFCIRFGSVENNKKFMETVNSIAESIGKSEEESKDAASAAELLDKLSVGESKSAAPQKPTHPSLSLSPNPISLSKNSSLSVRRRESHILHTVMDDDTYVKPKLGKLKKRPRNQGDNGKPKRQNSYPRQDDSSGTPKVVEIVYRILCPVKKIGSVLGKGGEIVNAIRDETHAKIRVSDSIPGAEERVVIIFNYPSKQSGKVNSDQNDDGAENESDEMHPHCPAQDALLKVHDRIAADEYLRGGVVHEKNDPDDTVTARLLVPSNQVGCLLGKGGTVIQKLRSHYTGANIRVVSSEHLPPCAMSNDELVQVSGMPMVVKKALYDISTRLHQHPRKENPPIDDLIYASTQKLFQHGASMPPPPPIWSNQQHDTYATPPPPWFGGYRNETPSYGPSSYNNSHIGNNGDTVDEFSLRILCPAGKIGGVIGKAGANIRQLERDTLARIQVEDTPPDAEERIINVTSREGPWDQISPTIEAILQLQIRTSAASEDGTITTRLLAPSSKVGCLLGQGGNIITEMRRRTRADIRVSSKEDKPNYTSANEELVQISGNHDVAREALLEILSRLRARTFRSGSAAVNNAHVIPDRVFTPPEIMSGRGMPSSHRIGAAENPAHVYPGHGFAPHENISSSGPLSSSIGRAGNTFGYEYPKRPETLYAAHGYPPVPPPAAAGYSNMTSTMEIQIPSSAMHSVLGMGGSNISNIQQISGAWVKVRDPHPGSSECVVEIHGTSEQLKMAQSLLQSYVSSGGQNATQSLAPSAAHAPLYRQY